MPQKILLVDDDKEFREEFKSCFSEYDFIEANNGEEALLILKKPNEIDLVILDVRMPGTRGTEILKTIKKMNPELSIIILTGYSSKDVAVESLKGRADDYIEKPFNIERTKEIIERIFESKDGQGDVETIDSKGKIEKVKHFIERNIRKRVTLQDAAASVFLSPKYLSRIFKEYTGKGFNEYRLSLSIKEAQTFLKKSAFNINQISDALGYQNVESFIRIFKKMTGRTPTSYRKKNKK